ncbi:thymidine kinase [Sphingobacterium spiritivorum ATCC 33300]|uniref:Thymidine kinase n=1 Tax=Sphingobacterium spiritivorum ATCC 33300 TaxID=525372 RepID=C2G5L9_SPHSI|nr:thymidine kinase [Sphingobacterium spiritivorum ATCC 33300]
MEIFKPSVDIRYDEQRVVSHDQNSISSTPVSNSSAILLLSADTRVVGIDEAQFFDDELPNVCVQLANKGLRVIVAGLDMDFKGKPFGPIPALMAVAEHVTKVHAVCVRCGAPANYSYRLTDNDKQVLLGEKESYEPRCRSCYYNMG